MVDLVQRTGFKTIEIVPAQFSDGVIGNDAITYLKTIWGEKEKKELKEKLKPFRFVTVHGTQIWVAVGHDVVGKKEETWGAYIELMRFARDIGSHIVTFHPLLGGG